MPPADLKPIEYASGRTPRLPNDWGRTAPLFAVVGGIFAWLKSDQYHSQGQFADERAATLLFVGLSVAGLIVTACRVPRYLSRGPGHLIIPILACVLAGLFTLLALVNHTTAYGARRSLPF